MATNLSQKFFQSKSISIKMTPENFLEMMKPFIQKDLSDNLSETDISLELKTVLKSGFGPNSSESLEVEGIKINFKFSSKGESISYDTETLLKTEDFGHYVAKALKADFPFIEGKKLKFDFQIGCSRDERFGVSYLNGVEQVTISVPAL